MSQRAPYIASPGEALVGRVFPHHGPERSQSANNSGLSSYPPVTAADGSDTDEDPDELELQQAEALLARDARGAAGSSDGAGSRSDRGAAAAAAGNAGTDRWARVTLLQSWSRFLTQRSVARRVVFVAAALAVISVSLYAAAANHVGSHGTTGRWGALGAASGHLRDAVYDRWTTGMWTPADTAVGDAQPLNISRILNFDTPQDTLKQQLKPGVRYIVANAYGGHSNQFIGIQKMLYFGKLTNRVGIIPTLIPAHLNGEPQDMSTFYDLDRFWSESHIPAVEFSRVKPAGRGDFHPRDENIACWSVYEACAGSANMEVRAFHLHGVNLQYWPLPPIARALGNFDLAYDGLRVFDFDRAAKNAWIDRVQREHLPQLRVEGGFKGDKAKNIKPGFGPPGRPRPDDQLMCFDVTLFLGPIMFPDLPVTAHPLEPRVAGEGLSWMNVGQYLRFNDVVESRADELLSDLFGVKKASKLPPFITVHLRRGDFKDFAGFTDLEKYESALARVQDRLQARLDDPDGWAGPGKRFFRSYGRKARNYPVLCTTDERGDSEFVKKVKSLGWKVVNHDAFGTAERYGGWWPTILDGAILARGRSFVGTDRSTYSHLAGLRVKYWNGGLVEFAR